MRIACANRILRPWDPGDVPTLVRHANNRNVSRWLRDRFPYPYTLADAEAWLQHVRSTPPGTQFAIEVDGEAVGGIGLEPGTDVARFAAELGYWLGEPFWGRGIATEAVRRITEFGFSRLGLLRIYAFPFVANPASIRVLEKAGFTREGILKASAVKDGRTYDQALYARINAAWQHPAAP